MSMHAEGIQTEKAQLNNVSEKAQVSDSQSRVNKLPNNERIYRRVGQNKSQPTAELLQNEFHKQLNQSAIKHTDANYTGNSQFEFDQKQRESIDNEETSGKRSTQKEVFQYYEQTKHHSTSELKRERQSLIEQLLEINSELSKMVEGASQELAEQESKQNLQKQLKDMQKQALLNSSSKTLLEQQLEDFQFMLTPQYLTKLEEATFESSVIQKTLKQEINALNRYLRRPREETELEKIQKRVYDQEIENKIAAEKLQSKLLKLEQIQSQTQLKITKIQKLEKKEVELKKLLELYNSEDGSYEEESLAKNYQHIISRHQLTSSGLDRSQAFKSSGLKKKTPSSQNSQIHEKLKTKREKLKKIINSVNSNSLQRYNKKLSEVRFQESRLKEIESKIDMAAERVIDSMMEKKEVESGVLTGSFNLPSAGKKSWSQHQQSDIVKKNQVHGDLSRKKADKSNHYGQRIKGNPNRFGMESSQYDFYRQRPNNKEPFLSRIKKRIKTDSSVNFQGPRLSQIQNKYEGMNQFHSPKVEDSKKARQRIYTELQKIQYFETVDRDSQQKRQNEIPTRDKDAKFQGDKTNSKHMKDSDSDLDLTQEAKLQVLEALAQTNNKHSAYRVTEISDKLGIDRIKDKKLIAMPSKDSRKTLSKGSQIKQNYRQVKTQKHYKQLCKELGKEKLLIEDEQDIGNLLYQGISEKLDPKK